MSKFKIGDAVRVKAGSPKKLWRHGFTWDASHSFGEKLIVEECYSNDKFENRVHLVGDHGVIENCYLEPWNDSEEWDGEKWVAKSVCAICDLPYAAKPKPAIVILREDGVLKPNSPPIVHESTSKAKEEAKRLAEKHKGREFVVLQEVDRKQVKETTAEKIARIDKEHREKSNKQSIYVAGDGSKHPILCTDVFAIDNTLIIKHSFKE